jgi:alpha-galactosidase
MRGVQGASVIAPVEAALGQEKVMKGHFRMNKQVRIALTLVVATMACLTLGAAAKDVPAVLPRPDGKPGDPTKPVKVYILAGQSNMCGMASISGAKSHYAGIYLTADPDATMGPINIYGGGLYNIGACGIHLSADPKADKGATASIYSGAHAPGTDYDKAAPAKTETVALGVVHGTLPTIDGPHTVVVRGFIDVPESGNYCLNPGYGDSTYNVMTLDGKEVYRKDVGGQAVKQKAALEAGKRYPVKITYFKGGSTAFWMSQEDLQGKGDLETVTRRDKKFPWLIDDKGQWTVCSDVWFQEARIAPEGKGCPLTATSNGKSIGPELGFGYVMGCYHDAEVLLIKTAMGNRALGFDFRPPSSGRTDPNSQWESAEYRLMVEGVHKTLDRIDKVVPGYKGQGYELAGFVWWQGHKDSFSDDLIAEYEKNMANMINDIRKEFKAPKMPAVVATVGFGGYHMAEKFRKIWAAQMAVADPAKHPEFAGTVATVDTRDFWREMDDSPGKEDYHYNRNAETYVLTGDALGRAMADLLEGKKYEAPGPKRDWQSPAAEKAEPTAEQQKAAQTALKPIILDGLMPAFIVKNHAELVSEAALEKPKRASQFLNDALGFGLTAYYRLAGINDYDWHAFGPDLRDMKWDYHSFDPQEKSGKKGAGGYRKVTYPEGMANWFAPDFDAVKAGWKSGLPPFGQLDGKLAPLSETCTAQFCGCGITPRSLWEKEVLLVRGTFEVPPLKEGCRYRIVVGGSAHVMSGEGYAIHVNGKKLAESNTGVPNRAGGQPRGAFIDKEFMKEFQGGKVTIAATSFLQFTKKGAAIPPRGHLSLWLEEQKIPPMDLSAKAAQ